VEQAEREKALLAMVETLRDSLADAAKAAAEREQRSSRREARLVRTNYVLAFLTVCLLIVAVVQALTA
jgi:hypothetical protein